MGEKVKNLDNPKCPCGKEADYICECGCLCCGEDPCAFGCGGSVKPLLEMLRENPSLEVRRPD